MQSAGSATERLLGLFQLEFQRAWGFPVRIEAARDRALLKRMHEQWGEETVSGLVPEFLRAAAPVHQGGDPVVSRCRAADVRDFYHHAPYLLLQRVRGPQLDRTTASNLHELFKAMRPTGGARHARSQSMRASKPDCENGE